MFLRPYVTTPERFYLGVSKMHNDPNFLDNDPKVCTTTQIFGSLCIHLGHCAYVWVVVHFSTTTQKYAQRPKF